MTAIGGYNGPQGIGAMQQRAVSISRYSENTSSGISSLSSGTAATAAYSRDVELQQVAWDDIRQGIEKAEQRASVNMVESLDAYLGENAEARAAGRTTDEYNAFRETLDTAVDNGNYRHARELAQRFYDDGSGSFGRQMDKIMSEADRTFAEEVRQSFAGYRLDGNGNGTQGGLHGLIQSSLNAAFRKNDRPHGMEQWTEKLEGMREKALDHGLDKLGNAGRNLYTENAESVLAATSDHLRRQLAGDQSVVAELDQQQDESQTGLNYGDTIGGLAARYDDLRNDFLSELQHRLGGRTIVEVVEVENPEAPKADGGVTLEVIKPNALQQQTELLEKKLESKRDSKQVADTYAENAETDESPAPGTALDIAV